MAEQLRGHGEEMDLGSGFEARWYAHRGGRPIAFRAMDEVSIYMARLGLPRPDELLAPVDY